MKSPSKIFLVVSRTAKRATSAYDLFFKRKRARTIAKNRNAAKSEGATDWRVETYVKRNVNIDG